MKKKGGMKKKYQKTSIAAVRFSNSKGNEYWRKQLKYSSLAFFQLSEEDRNYVLEKVLPLTTGKKAQKFVVKMHRLAEDVHAVGDSWKPRSDAWACTVLDKLGDVCIVRYKGVDIRLLYKRTVLEHPITEMCPEPDKPVIDPEDAWIYLDLVGNSARQMHAPTLLRLEELERELDLHKTHIKAQDNVIIETERNAYNKAMADMRDENKRVLTLLEKIEEKQERIPMWAMRYVNLAKKGTTVQDNPALLDVVKQIYYELGLAQMDDEEMKGENNENGSDGESGKGETEGGTEDSAHPSERDGKTVSRPSKGR